RALRKATASELGIAAMLFQSGPTTSIDAYRPLPLHHRNGRVSIGRLDHSVPFPVLEGSARRHCSAGAVLGATGGAQELTQDKHLPVWSQPSSMISPVAQS